MRQQEENTSGAWRAGGGLEVEYSLAAMEEIRAIVVRSFHQFSRGGLEIGGVLFGTHEGGVVRVETWQRIPCRHALGPGFKLTPEDEAELDRLLIASGQDPSLDGLVPVGWFLSRTRSEIALSDADRRLHARFFPEPWQVAIVFRPARSNSVRAAFFLAGEDGTLQASGDLVEFAPRPYLAGNERPLREEEVRELPAEPAAGSPGPSPPETVEVPVPVAAAGVRRRPRLWKAALLAVCWLGAAAAGFFLRPLVLPDAPSRPLLRAAEREGHLLIDWDANHPALRRAKQAVLVIDDGGAAREVALDAAMLASGNVAYRRRSETVTLRLRIPGEGSEPFEEYLQFLAPAPAAAPAPPPPPPEAGAPSPRERKLEAENAKLRERLEKESARAEQLRSQLMRHLRQGAASPAR